MTSFPKKVQNRLNLCGFILIISIITPFFSYLGVLKPHCEEGGIWFQRSGSIMVLLAVTIEILLSHLNKWPGLTGLTGKAGKNKKQNETMRTYSLIKYMSVIIAVLGTLIWGYGDLIYDSLN